MVNIYIFYLFIMICCILYRYVKMSAMTPQITGVSIVSSIVGSGAYQGKQQNFASLAFGKGIHRFMSCIMGYIIPLAIPVSVYPASQYHDWWCKEPSHQQLWHWLIFPRIRRPQQFISIRLSDDWWFLYLYVFHAMLPLISTCEGNAVALIMRGFREVTLRHKRLT